MRSNYADTRKKLYEEALRLGVVETRKRLYAEALSILLTMDVRSVDREDFDHCIQIYEDIVRGTDYLMNIDDEQRIVAMIHEFVEFIKQSQMKKLLS